MGPRPCDQRLIYILMKRLGTSSFFHFFQLCCSIWLDILSSLTLVVFIYKHKRKKTSPKLVNLIIDRLACRLAKLLTEEYLSIPLTYQTDWTANDQFTVEQSEHSFSSLIFLIAQSNNWLSCKILPSQAKRPCLLHGSSMQNCNGHSTIVLMLWWYWTKICRSEQGKINWLDRKSVV